MKRGWVGAALFLIFSLMACVEGQEVAVESTAVPTPPPTIEPTVVETAVPATATVGEETAVSTSLVPTETPTSPNPLASVPDLHQLTAVPLDAFATYRLKTPDYDFLRDWLSAARDTPLRGLTYFYIFDLLAFDFARSFPHGAGQLEPIFEEAQRGGYLDERITWPVLQTAVAAYLNQYQLALEDGNAVHRLSFTLKPRIMDLNNERMQIWLVEVEAKELSILGVVPLFIDQDGQYTILPHMIDPINTSLYSQATQQSFEYDFTGDGQADVFQAAEGYAGGPIAFINVYTWDGSMLSVLENINTSVPTYKPYAVYEIGDFTGDGAADVKVTIPHEVNFDCIWDEVDIYSWNGRTPQHRLMEETQMPDTPECAMFHAITPDNYYSAAVLAEKSRVELLEPALTRLTLETAPSADYLALGYLHLAMAYLEQNEVSKAQQALNQLYNLPDTASFVQLVKELYAENDGNLLSVCQQLYTVPEQVEATGISDYIYEGSITGFHGIGSEEINAEAICPYPRVVVQRLQALRVPIIQSPETTLAQFGYGFTNYVSANLDSDAELEWFGLVKGDYLFLTLLDQTGEELRPIVLTTTCLECADGFEYQIREGEESAYIIGRLNERMKCSSGGPFFVLPQPFLVQYGQEKFDFATIFTFCDSVDERPLSELTSADFVPAPPGPPSWRTLLREATGKSDWEWMRDVQTAVLTQTDPTVPEKITQLLTYLPSDDPDAQPYIEHLTYLLGYFYELRGEGENAVSAYLNLIQRYPTSPWSWLAWARLEPVEN